MKSGIPIIVSAPSGTGKSTVCKILRERIPDLKFSVSYTTRDPRPTETNGVDYFFVTEAQFKKRIQNGVFLEWTKVHSNFYGTAFESVHEAHKLDQPILLEVDVKGVEALRKTNFEGVFIMIIPPSIKELRKRLDIRSTESKDKIEQRIEVGKNEISQYGLYDYVVINHTVENTVQLILSIISAEEVRSSRFSPPSKDIAEILSPPSR